MTTANWIKILLRAEGVDPDEAAGALADLLGRPVETEQEEGGCALIAAWLEESPAAGDLAANLPAMLSQILPMARVTMTAITTVENQDWLERWRRSVQPITLGERIIVRPTFHSPPTGHGRIEITLDPGMAFGSGHHPTTAMCAAALEKYNAPSMLDIGCGAGILGVIAVKLGSRRVLGIDTDPEAVRVTKENARLNHVEEALETRLCGPESVNESFGAIAANLFMEPHLALAEQYWRLLTPGGALILSGLRLDQAQPVWEAMTRLGLLETERMIDGEWTALVFTRPPKDGKQQS